MNALADRAVLATTPRRWSRVLGYAGLVLFAPALALPWLGGQDVIFLVQDSVMAYGAVILSFVGALHWQAGMQALTARESTLRLVFSVLPALFGWLALLLEPVRGFALLIGAFVLVYRFDRRWPPGDASFLALRLHLTAGAVLCMTVAFGAALVTA